MNKELKMLYENNDAQLIALCLLDIQKDLLKNEFNFYDLMVRSGAMARTLVHDGILSEDKYKLVINEFRRISNEIVADRIEKEF